MANAHSSKQVINKTILIATGASGGHMFPAMAVADELVKNGYRPYFVGGGKKFQEIMAKTDYEYEELPAAPWNVRNPFKKMLAVYKLFKAFVRAVAIIHKQKGCAVFGTGGYATVAMVLAGKISGVSTIIHEQNVLPGRANKLLSKLVDKICISFDDTRHYLKHRHNTIAFCGNPVRESFKKAAQKQRQFNDEFTIFITGGSQGAKVLSDVVPAAVAKVKNADVLKQKLNIIHQARPEDVERVKAAYDEAGVGSKVESFFDNMPEILLSSNLIISRAGASAICECALLGRAAIFVPLRLADGHQSYNARVLEQKQAAIIIDQNDFTVEKLANELESLVVDRTRLQNMEKNALTVAEPDAAKNVALQVMNLADQDIMFLAGSVEKNNKNAE